jgi:hypothetical protein
MQNRKYKTKLLLFPSLPEEIVEELAEARRRTINKLLLEDSELQFEFIERPNSEINYLNYESEYLENPTERYGQMARLKWQLKSTGYLLLERLTDLIILFKSNDKEAPNYPLITLEILKKSERKKGGSRWKAVIESDNINYYIDRLKQYQSWIGIAVEALEVSRFAITPTGKCQASNKQGCIGGYIKVNGMEFGMTCAHVLAPDCGSVVYSKGQNYPFYHQRKIYHSPDAALISVNSPCFPAQGHYKVSLLPATVAVYITAADSKTVLNKIPLTDWNKKGYISNPGSLMPMVNGNAYRFPHMAIRLLQHRYFFGMLKWPIYSSFSKEGDSGSWITNANRDVWYGMLIGKDDLNISYVLQSEPLLDYFNYLIRPGAGQVIKPYILNP